MTRSKELVDSFYKLGMGISYSNVLLLHDVWTMHDLERCSTGVARAFKKWSDQEVGVVIM